MKNYLSILQSEEKKPVIGLKDLSRLAASEGIVLLKNENEVLPLVDQTISVFGRIQHNYYKSGTGSGGLVNVDEVISMIDAFLESPFVKVNTELLEIYRQFEKENPFNAGSGLWASEPWSQVEMPLTDEMVIDARKLSEVAIVIIGRTAGEDRDNSDTEGSYRLSKGEELMLQKVTSQFDKVVVVLNTGNVIDMSFMDKYVISSVLYVWHGGQEGARACVDVLTNLVSPSGKLPDTIAYQLSDYPSYKTFGGHEESIYEEDIYVGYRYFSTFHESAVRYPFGFGLSYTTFNYHVIQVNLEETISITVKVKNEGKYAGKEVVQVYVSQPQGLLGKPKKVLVQFAKTGVLKPGEAEVLSLNFDPYDFSSYDEMGLTGYPSSYVLEQGKYIIELSSDSQTVFADVLYEVIETRQIMKCEENVRPVKPFKRIKPHLEDDQILVSYEDVPLRSYDISSKINKNKIKELKEVKRTITFHDVYQEKETIEAFVSQFSLEELAQIIRGEGMSSPKVTPGTASAFGGVTEDLKKYGIPIVCCSDGPSGIRMDSGMQATSMPNGTLLASTMNVELCEALYYGIGLEMIGYDIEVLLGPGMNIHRYPLCGRNFEYFSEDPILTGYIGAAIVNGLQKAGVTGTIKHIALNNQEYRRFDANSIASERAIREIYLKGYEIAVKKAEAKALMTSYNPINGTWAAGHYDMISGIIRKEWGFKGIIMTDWWAKMNDDQENGSRENTKAMIKAQGDLYMVVLDSKSNSLNDNTLESIRQSSLKKSEIQQAAVRIISFLLNSYTYRKQIKETIDQKIPVFPRPILKSVYLNQALLDTFDSRKTHYYLDCSDDFYLTFDIEDHVKYQVKRNAHTVIVSLLCHQSQNHYVFTNRKKYIQKDTFNLEVIPKDNIIKINDEPWGRTKLVIHEGIWHNEKITIEKDIIYFQKDGMISFPLDILSYGKYIIELQVSSDLSPQAQIPFSVMSEDVVLSTLTTNGTEGSWFDIASQVIIDKGIKRLILKAHASGLKIKRIECIKHN